MKNKRGILIAIIIAVIVVLGAVGFLLFKKENLIVGKSSSALNAQEGKKATATVNGMTWSYTQYGNNATYVYLESTGDETLGETVEIPSILDDHPVISLEYQGETGENIFYNAGYDSYSNIKRIVLPDGLKTIGNHAFFNCVNLKNINIPDSLQNIGNNAFKTCRSLVELEIPEGITSIGEYTFDGCRNLESITIPSSVTNIGQYAFKDCNELEYIYFDKTKSQVEALGEYWDQTLENVKKVYIDSKLGDVNFDGEIDVIDITKIQKYVEGYSDTIDRYTADTNKDGEITREDYEIIQRYRDGNYADSITLDEYVECVENCKIIIKSVHIKSDNNLNTNRAKMGDTITVTIQTVGKVYNLNEMDVRIAGKEATIRHYEDENSIIATYIAHLTLTEDIVNDITEEDLEDGKLKVSIRNYETISGYRGEIIYGTDGSYVILDTTAPDIVSIEAKGYDEDGNQIDIENEQTVRPLSKNDTIKVSVTFSESVEINSTEGEPLVYIGDKVKYPQGYTFSNGVLVYNYNIDNDDNGYLRFGNTIWNIKDNAGNENTVSVELSDDKCKTNGIIVDTSEVNITGVNLSLSNFDDTKPFIVRQEDSKVIARHVIIGIEVKFNKKLNITESTEIPQLIVGFKHNSESVSRYEFARTGTVVNDNNEYTTIEYSMNTRYGFEPGEYSDEFVLIELKDGQLYDFAGNEANLDLPSSYTINNCEKTLYIDRGAPNVNFKLDNEDDNISNYIVNGVTYTKYCDFINDNVIYDNYLDAKDSVITLKNENGEIVSNYNKVIYSDLSEMKLRDGEYFMTLADKFDNERTIHFVVDSTKPDIKNIVHRSPTDEHDVHVTLEIDDNSLSEEKVKLYKLNENDINDEGTQIQFNYRVNNITADRDENNNEIPTTYKVVATDNAGNESTKYFKIDLNDTTVDFDKVEYGDIHIENGIKSETVTITANEYLQELDGWTLSDDRKSLSKTYTSNATEIVTIEDLCGNTKEVNIQVDNLEDLGLTFSIPEGESRYVKENDEMVIYIHSDSDRPFKIDEFKVDGKDAIMNDGLEYRNDFTITIPVDSSMPEGPITLTYTCTFQDTNEGTKRGSFGESDEGYDLYIIDREAPILNSIEAVAYDKENNPIGIDEEEKTVRSLSVGEKIRVTLTFSETFKIISMSGEPLVYIGEKVKDYTGYEFNNNVLTYIYEVDEEDQGMLKLGDSLWNVEDLAGNNSSVSILNCNNINLHSITVDTEAPIIDEITLDVQGERYTDEQGNVFVGRDKTIIATVKFSKDMKINGQAPKLTIKIGDTEKDNINTFSNTYRQLNFYYPISESDYGEVNIVSFNGENLTDVSGNRLDSTLPEVSSNIFVDTKIGNIKTNLVNDTSVQIESQDSLVYLNDFISNIEINDESGVNSYTLKNNNQEVSGYTLSQVIAKEGYWTLDVTDNVGNTGTFNFMIDNTAPVIKLNSEDVNDIHSIDNVKLTIIEDNTDKVELYKDGQKVEFNYATQDTIFEPGEYRIVVTDKAGNVTEKTFSIERKAPTVDMYLGETNIPYTGDWTNQNVRVELSVEDTENLSEIQYRITENGEWKTAVNNKVVFDSFSGAGFEARAKYNNGKYSSITDAKVIKIDKINPNITDLIINPAENTQLINGYYNGDVNITFPQGADSGPTYSASGIKENHYIINGENSTAAQRTLNASGIYEIEYYVIDNAGNESVHKTATIKIDKDAPIIDYLDAENNKLTIESQSETDSIVIDEETIEIQEFTYFNQYVILDITDNDSGIDNNTKKLFKYDKEVSRYVEYQGMPIQRDGRYIITVKDNVGHRTTKGFVVDLTSPIIKINGDYPEVTIGNTIKYNYYNTDAEIDALDNEATVKAYKKDENGNYTEEYRFLNQIHKITEDGVYKVIATDSLGNQTVVYVVIDRVAPTFTKSVLPDANTWTSGNVTLTIVPQDSISGISSVTVGGQDVPLNTSNTAEATIQANGEYRIVVADSCGNSREDTVVISNIDKTAPAITSITPNTTQEVNEVTLTVVAQDVGSGIVGYSWDNGQTWITTNTLTVTNNGTYTVKVKDNVGNISEGSSITVNNIKTTEIDDETYFRFTNYTQKTENGIKYVVGISTYTEVSDFERYIQKKNLTYTIVDKEGNAVSSTDIVTTNMKVIVSNGDEYILAVKGDLNSYGDADITDLGIMARYIVGNDTMPRVYQLAADINGDNIIDISDVSILATAITRNIRL